jgi:hypothetical protein
VVADVWKAHSTFIFKVKSVQEKGNRILGNVTNYWPDDTVLHLAQMKSEAAPLRKTKIPQSCISIPHSMNVKVS